MQRITRDTVKTYTLNPNVPPALRVKPGESFVVETEDAISGKIRTSDVLPIPEHVADFGTEPPKLNPLAGPIYVEGAEKGDLLAVSIEQVIPDSQGVVCRVPGVGPLADSKTWIELTEPASYIIKHVAGPSGTTRDGRAIYNDKLSWNLRPFIGTIGVTPEIEAESALMGQGPWGGNFDCRDMKEGTTLFVNCYHEGGLLYLGDVHGTQGDTEFFGVANETRAEVVLSCRVVKNKRIPFPRLEKAESIVSMFSYRPLEDAVKKATINLMDWLVKDYGLSKEEAYLQVEVNPDFRINVYQMISLGRIQYTVGAELPRSVITG